MNRQSDTRSGPYWRPRALAGMFLLTAGLGFGLYLSGQPDQNQPITEALAREGKEVQGVVVRDYGRQGSRFGHTIEYSYSVSGKVYQDREIDGVTRSASDYLPPGTPITVTYLPSDPAISGLNPDSSVRRERLARIGLWIAFPLAVMSFLALIVWIVLRPGME